MGAGHHSTRGAIVVLFLFVVLLLPKALGSEPRTSTGRTLLALAGTAAAVLLPLAPIVASTSARRGTGPTTDTSVSPPSRRQRVRPAARAVDAHGAVCCDRDHRAVTFVAALGRSGAAVDRGVRFAMSPTAS
jgi:hypothetical protein